MAFTQTSGLIAIVAFLASTSLAVAQDSASFETSARQAILLDAETGTVLFEKDAETTFPPASLAKVMTAELVLAAIAEGTITNQTTYRVSEGAWRAGGAPSGTATMFAGVRSDIAVENLLRGLMVQQANDAAIILAEGLEGSELAFAQAMNERASALAMLQSTFVNATGLPEDGQATSMRDMAILARHVRNTYPEAYRIYSEPDFEWNGIRQRNRNPLLGLDIGATGIATGFTEGLGYSLLGAAERDGRTTIVAFAGVESERERTAEARRLLDFGFVNFERRVMVDAGDTVGVAQVYGGATSSVPLVTDDELVAYLPSDRLRDIQIALVYDGPLQAPVEEGLAVGRVEVRLDGRVAVSHPLKAGASVAEGGFAERALGAARELAFGWIRTL